MFSLIKEKTDNLRMLFIDIRINKATFYIITINNDDKAF
jgi:hypothetical protein